MKFLRFILLSLPILVALNAEGRSMYALLIGIGDYPENSGWNVIHGNNDVPLIESCLLRQGFLEENIIKLVDVDATKGNILASFDKLYNNVQVGDVVYIHFSGHGQQVTDLDGDEEDGFDEAWIPYDAQKSYKEGVYEGENHLIDDELNVLLTDLRLLVGQAGKIIVVADTCHSGTSSRGQSDLAPARGCSDKFIFPKSAKGDHRESMPTDWLSIEACQPYEYNFEYKTSDGEYFGLLSYIIANDTRLFGECGWSELLSEWGKKVSEISENSWYPQNLYTEGMPNQNSQYMF